MRLFLTLLITAALSAQNHLGLERVELSEAASQLFVWTSVVHDADERIVSEDAKWTLDFDKETVTRNDRAVSTKSIYAKTQISTQARLWSAVRELTTVAAKACGTMPLTTENRVFTMSASRAEFLVADTSGKNLLSLTPETAVCPGDRTVPLTEPQSRVAVGYMQLLFRIAASITDWFASVVEVPARVQR